MNVNTFYPDEPLVRLLSDGREIRLEEDFSLATTEEIYTVPKGFIANGSSFPRLLWALTGGPLTGKHRLASIIHDWLCTERKVSWQKAHKVYYLGCLLGGVDKLKARSFYDALVVAGIKWNPDGSDIVTSDWDDELDLETIGG